MTPTSPAKGYVEAWDVESLSEPGKTYVVSRRRNGEFACSCPAWKFHKAPKPHCKHIRALRLPDDVRTSFANVLPVAQPGRMVRVSFDGVFVAELTEAEAQSFRFGLTRKKPPEPVAVVVSTEFRITRKFRLED